MPLYGKVQPKHLIRAVMKFIARQFYYFSADHSLHPRSLSRLISKNSVLVRGT